MSPLSFAALSLVLVSLSLTALGSSGRLLEWRHTWLLFVTAIGCSATSVILSIVNLAILGFEFAGRNS